MATQGKPERNYDLRKLSIFAVIAAGIIIASAIGILLGTNRIYELAPGDEQYTTLKVVDRVIDDGTTLCVVEWQGKLRTVFGGVGLADIPCPVPIGTDVPVIIEKNFRDGVDAGAISFDRLGYLWGPDVRREP